MESTVYGSLCTKETGLCMAKPKSVQYITTLPVEPGTLVEGCPKRH